MPHLPPRITTPRASKGWRPREIPRLRGTTLQNARRRLLEQQPLCVECLAVGKVTPATIRDHIIPLAEGGLEDRANTNCQMLCVLCHERKRIAEATRGLRRTYPARR